MISIVVCSIKPLLLEKLKDNINHTIGVPYEVISIDNRSGQHSICSAYNFGAQQARCDYLCFVHEDILFHTSKWGEKLVNHLSKADVSLVGVLGCTVKTTCPSGVYTNIQTLNRINQLQRYPDQSLVHYYDNPYNESLSEVSTLDGIFLACRKDNWSKKPFDSEGLRHFHGYDIDFSLAQSENGKVVVVYDILIEHISFGNNTKEWIDAQLYINKKWAAALPLIKEKNISKALLKQADIENCNQLIVSLVKNNYKIGLALRLALKTIARAPFQKINLFYLKNIPLRLLSR